MFEWLWAKRLPSRDTKFAISRQHRRDPKIYISYRRRDSAGVAGRLFDLLVTAVGPENVFMDVDTIAPGENFVDAIRQEVEFADVFLVLIGHEWSTVANEEGRRRIDDPHDFIRLEIESALRSGKPLVPVLIEGAKIPDPRELPDTLKPLTHYSAISLDHATFRRDVEVLIKGIRQLVETRASEIDNTISDQKSVFVSHSSTDRQWVESEIVEFLSANKIKPWYSAHSISTAAQWEREILRGMEACEWFSLIVSPASAESDWVKDELFWAMENRPTRIVPIIMRKCDLYRFHIRLPRIQHVDFTGNRIVSRQKLLAAFEGGL